MMGFVLLAVAGLLVLVLIGIYNGLVKSKIRVDEAWSDITVQLKRRIDLIPNLVETVKGYAKHEKGVFEEVTKARAAMTGASGVAETAAADNMLTGALKSLFAVAEAYPDLKANTNFLDLQAELVDTEDKIQAARRFYNASVREFNTKVKVFPTVIFANMLGFKEREFFELEESEQSAAEKPVDVKF
ncbi:MAG: LemA family protein [Candidatus Saccharibacteria bacterium]|nr:LemA family protein [Candidatus Saccharibacteria bacterium]